MSVIYFRLSRLASAHLTDSNPNITDLSDPNRPIRLAEMFSELYCNEWTDAFETLSKVGKYDDDEAVNILLTIVTVSFVASKHKCSLSILI